MQTDREAFLEFTKGAFFVLTILAVFALFIVTLGSLDRKPQEKVPLTPLDQKVMGLEKKLEAVEEPPVVPEPANLPAPVVQQTPELPVVPPQPPVTTPETVPET